MAIVEAFFEQFGGDETTIFPHARPAPGGTLVAMPQLKARDNGTLVCLHGGEDIGNGIGHTALFTDSEGNTLRLYSQG